MKNNKKCHYNIADLKAIIEKLRETVMFDNMQIAKYDDENKKLKKRIKELEEK